MCLVRSSLRGELLIGIAVDAGGTRLRVAAYEGGSLLGRREALTTGSYTSDYKSLEGAISELLRLHKGSSGEVGAVGLALAGKVNPERTRLTASMGLQHFVGKPIVEALGSRFECPVYLGNDAEAAALAEAYGQNENRDFVLMIWGTGVGGACVRQAPSGPLVIPMEPGHITVKSDEEVLGCTSCEQKGHLQALCGGGRLFDRFGKTALRLSAEEWDAVVVDMCHGLESVLLTQPVRLIMFSGAVACGQPWLMQRFTRYFADSPRYGDQIDFKIAPRGEIAGELGALLLIPA